MSWLTRLALRIIPESWRAAVTSDLAAERQAGGRGSAWTAWEAVRVGVPLRCAVTGQAFGSEVRYAIRSLWHSPWFTTGAVLTFAIGIGVNAAVFSMLDRLLFRPMPYARPSELAVIWPTGSDGRIYMRTPKPLVIAAKDTPHLLAGVAGGGQSNLFAVPGAGEDEPGVRLTDSTYQMLSVLGVHPVVGRDFTRDDALGKARVALVSHAVWQRRFGGRADVLGQKLGRATPVEIIGVLPDGFVSPSMFWQSGSDGFILNPDLLETSTPEEGVWPVVVRLASGVTLAQAQAALDTIAASVSSQIQKPEDPKLRVLVESLQAGMFHNYRIYLWLIGAASGMVLLVACANLSNLLLVRGRSREHVAALRSALGASQTRIVVIGLAECGLVALAGSTVAFGVLWLSWHSLLLLEPSELRQYATETTNLRVLAMMVLAVVALIGISGVAPALRASRTDAREILQQGTKAGRRNRSWASRGLLVAEAGLGVLLVSGAVVASRSLVSVLARDLGYEAANLEVVRANLPAGDPAPVRMAMYEQLLDIVRQQPGVISAGGIDTFTVGTNTAQRGFPLGKTPRPNGRELETYLYQVTPSFFATVQSRLVAGRAITDDDVRGHEAVAVISESGARLLWPNEPRDSAIGRTLGVPNEPERRIVGVLADPRATQMRPVIAAAYVPYGQADPKFATRLAVMDIVARMQPGAALNVATLRDALRRESPKAGLTVRSTAASLDPAVQQPRLQAYLLTSFAICALLLAGLGMYTVSSLDVALRRYEMGVRLSLGATAQELRWLVMRTSLSPVVMGVALGLVGAWWAGQYMQTLLVEGHARDPLMMGLSAAILIGAAAAAVWWPARQAARTDPATVLRAQ